MTIRAYGLGATRLREPDRHSRADSLLGAARRRRRVWLKKPRNGTFPPVGCCCAGASEGASSSSVPHGACGAAG
jgi:hypothetical protein